MTKKWLRATALLAALTGTGAVTYTLTSLENEQRLKKMAIGQQEQLTTVHTVHQKNEEFLYRRLQEVLDNQRNTRDAVESLKELVSPQDTDTLYDFDNRRVDFSQKPLESLVDAIHPLKVETTFTITHGEEVSVYHAERVASGFFLPGNYVLTANHVVTIPPPNTQGELHSEEMVSVKVGDEWVVLEDVLRKPEYDMAILHSPVDVTTSPYPLGHSNELRIGNFLYLIGNPAYDVPQVRGGEVSSLEGLSLNHKGYRKDNSIVVNNGLNPGDSGHPLFALRDGRPELIGICQLKINNRSNFERIGGIITIDAIRDVLQEEFQAHPKDYAQFQDLYQLFSF